MVRGILLYTFFCIFGLFLQSSVFHTFLPGSVMPDLICILVLGLALQSRSVAGLFGAFLLGLVLDFGSARYVGPNAGGAAAAFFIAVYVAERVYAEKGVAVLLLAFLCSLAKSSIVNLHLFFYAPGAEVTSNLFVTVILEALLTALFAPFVLWLLRKFQAEPGIATRQSSSSRSWTNPTKAR